MNKLCKVKPRNCQLCISANKNYELDINCDQCEENNVMYELLAIGHSESIGDWAMVLRDGKITRVDLNRVWDVKSKELVNVNFTNGFKITPN